MTVDKKLYLVTALTIGEPDAFTAPQTAIRLLEKRR